MRTSKAALIIGVVGLLLAVVGCSKHVAGTALPDPTKVPLALAADGYGIVAGFDEAPARIEIYTEPQCSHCGDLQRDFGDQLQYFVNVGRLQITYRPLTFLDDDYDGYSSKVANALFLAAGPVGDAAATGTQFQRFVQELWVNQDPGGPAFTGDELRDIAIGAGLPEAVADNIASDDEAVDIADMEDANFTFLFEIDPVTAGTPTVYDLEAEDKIDIFDDDWLDKVVQS
ncbi:MAG TPA: thioredoxin domain-containing protein [Mycobacterium sp.]|nr:thioredoxin domain-containing protein [Mycobacterium sp.]